MARDPRDAPFGGKPVLPPPTSRGAQRAASLFRRLVQAQRDDEPQDPDPLPSDASGAELPALGPQALPGPDDFGGGRRYDLALSVVAAVVQRHERDHEREAMSFEAEVPGRYHATDVADEADAADATRELPPSPLDDEVTADMRGVPVAAEGVEDLADIMAYVAAEAANGAGGPDDSAGTEGFPGAGGPTGSADPGSNHATPLPQRPPPGSPMVRPSVQNNRADPEPTVDSRMLASTAQSAMIVEEPGGGTSFDITFRDDVFEDLACRITIHGDRVIAVFRVQNQNLRRLLEAESGRLRAQLEGRGLRVEEVRVEVGA